jgi:hypothetical protein
MPLDHEDQDMPELVRQLFAERRLDALGEIVARHYPRLRSLACSRLKQKKVPAAVYDADDALGSSLNDMMRLVLTGRVESIKDVDGPRAGHLAFFSRAMGHAIAERSWRSATMALVCHSWTMNAGGFRWV